MPPQQLLSDPGHFELQFENTGVACANAKSEQPAVFNWTLDGQSGSWCVQPVLQQNESDQDDFTGLWFAGEQDPAVALVGAAEKLLEVGKRVEDDVKPRQAQKADQKNLAELT